MTTRRNFLRVAGTSAVILAAGGAALTQVDQMPEAAVEGWRGPLPSVRDPRVRALSYALLAPNPHNMQAWIADIREPGVVTFHCDRARLLPQTDPFARQIVIGCGCFLETLRIAAAELGYRVEQQVFPRAPWPENAVGEAPLARLVFTRDTQIVRDPLFAHVLRRRSSKVAYHADEPARADHVAAIAGSLNEPLIAFGWTAAPREVARLREIADAAYRVESNTSRTHMETVERLRMGADEIASHRDGLSIHGPLIWVMKQAGVISKETLADPKSLAFKQTVDLYSSWIWNTWSFAWMTSATNNRAAQLATGAAYVRANLKATEIGLSMAPLSQALQEFPEMAGEMTRMRAATGTREDHTLQMFLRMGYAAAVPATPRRPVEAIIRA